MKVIIEPYQSPYFPWKVRAKGYTNVFETLEAAKNAAYGRFGNCDITIKTK